VIVNVIYKLRTIDRNTSFQVRCGLMREVVEGEPMPDFN
jgi:hypothetical protein